MIGILLSKPELDYFFFPKTGNLTCPSKLEGRKKDFAGDVDTFSLFVKYKKKYCNVEND